MVRFCMLNGKDNAEIYKFINKSKLDVVSKPIAESHGLPNECYISQEYTKIERKKLFEDKWVVVGVASSVPNKGDAKPFILQYTVCIHDFPRTHQLSARHLVLSRFGE